MTAAIEERLVALRRFLSSCPPELAGARLVQYRGVDLLARTDVSLAEIEAHVASAVREGRSVDWLYRHQLLYVRVTDFANAGPSWQRLFAEMDMDEMKSMLRDADPGLRS